MTLNKKIMLPKIELALGIFITLIILFLHYIFMSHAGGLWRDEVCQINHATMPSFSDIWSVLRVRAFPLLSVFVLRLWTSVGLGASDSLIRLYGFLVGTSILGALWLNARLMGYRIPLLSLALFGLSPLTIQIGDSIRPYGLGVFFIILTFGLIWKVIIKPSFWWILPATLVAVLSVQCFFQNAYLLLAICVGGLVITLHHKLWRRTLLLLGIGVVAAISLFPYWDAIKVARDWAHLTRNPSRLWEFGLVFFRAFGYSGETVLYSSTNIVFLFWISIVIMSISIAIHSYYHRLMEGMTDRKKDITLYSITAMLTGMIALIILLRRTGFSTQPWHFFPGIALVAVSLDTIIGTKYLSSIKLIVITILIVILSFGTAWKKAHTRQTNIDLICTYLAKSISKGDMIIVYPWYCGITFQRYYRGDIPWVTFPPIKDFTLTRYDLFKEQMILPDPIQPVLSKIAQTLQSGNQIWLVGNLPQPEEGQSPRSLPPAPNSHYGWRSGPYYYHWGKQARYFIQTHIMDHKYLQISPNIPILENLSVEVVKGWCTK